jgi:hypothetical protein
VAGIFLPPVRPKPRRIASYAVFAAARTEGAAGGLFVGKRSAGAGVTAIAEMWIRSVAARGGERACSIAKAVEFQGAQLGTLIQALRRRVRDLLNPPLAEHGEIGGGHNRPDTIMSASVPGYGTSSDYTLRRLQRDRPDLASLVLDGTVSANAAAQDYSGQISTAADSNFRGCD